MQTLPPQLWRGQNPGHFPFPSPHQSSGRIFGNRFIGAISEVKVCYRHDVNPVISSPLRCDSRNLGLSPLCDLDRNIPMPARFNKKVMCWVFTKFLCRYSDTLLAEYPEATPSYLEQTKASPSMRFCFVSASTASFTFSTGVSTQLTNQNQLRC